MITYTYDPLRRLTNAQYSSGACFSYNYDPVGNMTQVTETITSTRVTAYIYDVTSRLQTSKVDVESTTWYYRFDGNGNLVEMTPNGSNPNNGAIRYSYDTANHLNKVETYSGSSYTVLAQMGYDGLGNRARLIAWAAGVPLTTTYATRIAGQVQLLEATSGSITTAYLYGLTALGEFGSQSVYYLTDGTGSARQLVDPNGAVKLARMYEPFGQVLMQKGTSDPAFGYLGIQVDRITGLLYINGRYYDPVTGRFLTPSSGEQNPYVPYAGAALAPILILALLRRKKKGQIWTGWLVLAVMASVGLGLVACGGESNQGSSTPKPTATTRSIMPPQTSTPVSTPSAASQPPAASPTSSPTPTCTPTPSSTPTAGVTEDDVTEVVKSVAGEAGGLIPENERPVADNGIPAVSWIWGDEKNRDLALEYLTWVIRNRIDSPLIFPGCDTPAGCAKSPDFQGRNPTYVPSEHEKDVVRQVLNHQGADPILGSVFFHDTSQAPGAQYQARLLNLDNMDPRVKVAINPAPSGFYFYTAEQWRNIQRGTPTP